ncbi:MAG: TIGR04282 family arsenosugar biosynthesis glycosyltransferase [Acetobacteraceae bacterium]|nr:TIGR04282 family arsenosugar biosynthesis glycosyltransferase [Acetobacteraceae bacterium]
MAKAPRPGLAKTRLIPALGAEGAAALARAFLIDSAALARGAAMEAGAEAYVIATPDDACAELASLTDLPALPQGEGDLGARIVAAFAALFARGHAPVMLLGADTPALPPAHIEAALALAQTAPSFGPTGDGGYWTVALPAPAPALFEAIAWGGPTVLAETEAAARRAGLAIALAPPWDDVDEPADLAALRRQLAANPAAAPATRAALAEHADRG